MTRLALDMEGAEAGVAQFQQALSAHQSVKIARSSRRWRRFVGTHLARRVTRPRRSSISSLPVAFRVTRRSRLPRSSKDLRANPAISVWEKNPYRLSPAPEAAAQAFRESFEQALGWAEEGLWSSAASAFELLAAGSAAGVFADRNRGLCCLWLADHDGAVAALRRYIARSKPTTDTVDLETLCQLIEPPSRYDLIDIDRLSWPIRNREGLLAALRGDRAIAQAEPRRARRMIRSLLRSRVSCFSIVRVVEARPGLTGAELPWSRASCSLVTTSPTSKPSMTAGSIA